MSSLTKQVHEFEPEIIRIRRKIHSNPELAYQEFETARLIASKLRGLGIRTVTGLAGTGVLGVLNGARTGKVVALRADMDALPINEKLDVPFKSKKNGIMHACGHDAHVAMLLGAAMLLRKNMNEVAGTVKFIFQPAEEEGGRGGAKPMIEAGVMSNPKVDYVFGLHIVSNFPSGVFALRGGPIMAAPDTFKIRVLGKGGHGSEPHKAVDPIYIASQLTCALQGISGRMVDQLQPFVISVCSFHAGSTHNIIPDDAVLEGTMRTFNEKLRSKAKKHVIQVSKMICKTFGAQCEVEFKADTYPVTRNNEKVAVRVAESLQGIEGTRTIECEPILGAEDVSRFLRKAPGTYYFLGTQNEKKRCIYPNHSPQFNVDEEVLKYGSVSLARLAMEFGANH
jgi:carboxypeptidase Ss1